MYVLQLGNGGGFDFNKTNSSFLIKNNETTILFDCGFNIMNRLTSDRNINIEEIDYVYISHMDEDHIGNLKMFIYWRYFKYDKFTYIICDENIENDIKNYLKDLNKELIGCKTVKTNMFFVQTVNAVYKRNINNDISIQSVKCNHGNIKTYGAIFKDRTKYIFISGDTKASKYIEEISKDCDLIFHDYSNWDFVTRNVHTCKTDFELEYSKKYQEKAIKYHTGDEDFKKDWYEI